MKPLDCFRSDEKVKYAVKTISIDALENEVKKKWLVRGVVPTVPYRANDEKAPPIVASDWWIAETSHHAQPRSRVAAPAPSFLFVPLFPI